MSNISSINFSEIELQKLLPATIDIRKKISEWESFLKRHKLDCMLSDEMRESILSETSKKLFNEIPPFLQLGRINFDENEDSASFIENKTFPALLFFRDSPGIIFSPQQDSKKDIIDNIQLAFLRLFLNLSPELVACTIIDSKNFGAEFTIISSAVPSAETLSNSSHISEFFDEIQNDLRYRNQVKGFSFENLYEYNKEHQDTAVPYKFIFIGSYEDDLSEEQKNILNRMLQNSNAAKVGIYIFIQFSELYNYSEFEDTFNEMVSILNYGYNLEEITFCLSNRRYSSDKHGGYFCSINKVAGTLIDKLITQCKAHTCNKIRQAVRLDLPINSDELVYRWSKSNTEDGILVPIGKSGGNILDFELGGKQIVHNALVGGAVGTGKTNLLHAIILQSLSKYDPEQLKLSILDYKYGTEFNCYKEIPHLYALSLGPDTKFGLDLLLHFKSEINRISEKFKSNGVTNIAAYRKKTGVIIPRHLVVIDEFQVLLGDGKNGSLAQQILEDLIRRGRAFGYNFILSSQSLKDCTLSTPAKSNIGCRICLRLSESDCSDFLSIENNVPSKFEYTGQAVLNKNEGRIEGNVEFNVAYYDDVYIHSFI